MHASTLSTGAPTPGQIVIEDCGQTMNNISHIGVARRGRSSDGGKVMRVSFKLSTSAAVAAFLLPFIGAAAQAKQIALVIGNGHYAHVVGIEKASAAAEAYAAVIADKGFAVPLKYDLTGHDMAE